MESEIFRGSTAVAETARDTKKYTGFIASLFAAKSNFNLFFSQEIPRMGEHALEVRQRLCDILSEKVDADKIDAEGEIPEEVIRALAEIGMFGIKIPPEYGGMGLKQSEYQKLAIPFGSHSAPVAVLISAANSIGVPEPLKQFGTETQKKKYLPRLAGGEISGFALTEPGAGCDISEVKTYALRVKKYGKTVGYLLNGEKLYTTNAPKNDREFLASLLVVIAQIVDAPSDIHKSNNERAYGAFVVETHSPGCFVKKRLDFMGVRGIFNGRIGFENVFVPLENRLRSRHKAEQGIESDGLFIALSTLTIGRLTLPAACLGALKQALRFARWWGNERAQWGKPIIGHTLVGEKITRIAARALALEAMVAVTGAWVDTGQDVRLESAAIKVLASEWLLEALVDLRQIRGGRGFETVSSLASRGEVPLPVERMLRDAIINTTWEGTSEIMRVWMTREGLEDFISTGIAFQKARGPKKLWPTLSYISKMAAAFSPFLFPELRIPQRWRKEAARFRCWLWYIEFGARTLAFLSAAITAYYQKELEKKQIKTARLITAAMKLFAMAAVIWYASSVRTTKDGDAYEMSAKYFCQQTVSEIRLLWLWFKTLCSDDDKRVDQLSRLIAEGKFKFLEEGIIPLPHLNHPSVD